MTRQEIPWEVGDPAVVRCDDPDFDGREGVVRRVAGGRVLVVFGPPPDAYDAEPHELDSPRPLPPTNRRRLPLPPGRAGSVPAAAAPGTPGPVAGPARFGGPRVVERTPPEEDLKGDGRGS